MKDKIKYYGIRLTYEGNGEMKEKLRSFLFENGEPVFGDRVVNHLDVYHYFGCTVHLYEPENNPIKSGVDIRSSEGANMNFTLGDIIERLQKEFPELEIAHKVDILKQK